VFARATVGHTVPTPARARAPQAGYRQPPGDSAGSGAANALAAGKLYGDPMATGKLYGDPIAAGPYWHRQSYYDDCAEMAVADVVGVVTGHEPTEQDIVTFAENTSSSTHLGPIYDPHHHRGTNNLDVGVLLERYGVHSITSDNEGATTGASDGTDLLEQSLAHGQKVVVGVNANILWNKPTGDRTAEDHFVVVTGIDINAGVVHLNDSGVTDGRDEQISIATFAAAWATSHDEKTVTDPVNTQVDMTRGWAGYYPRSGLRKG
jgi:hypothetical protein